MSNIIETKGGLVEKSTGRKIKSPLDMDMCEPPNGYPVRLLTAFFRFCVIISIFLEVV